MTEGSEARKSTLSFSFVLSMEYLSRLFKQVTTTQGFEFLLYYRQLGMTHLIFTYDLIILYKAAPTSIQMLMNAFKKFTNCLGQRLIWKSLRSCLGGHVHKSNNNARHIMFYRATFPF